MMEHPMTDYPSAGAPEIVSDRNATIARLRAALKRRSGRVWSVTGGTGTVSGWIRIDVPPMRRTWRHRLKPGCPDWPWHYEEYDSSQPGGHMGPDDRAALAALLGLGRVHPQGERIPASHDYRREYLARAEGRVPDVIAQPYWD